MATIGDTSKDVDVAGPPTDCISSLHWSPMADHIAGSSWDNMVRIWEVNEMGQSRGMLSFSHDAPVLTCRWTKDGTKVASAGADKIVKLHDLNHNQSQQVASHDAPIKSIRFYEDRNMLVTGSWDKTIRFWDLRTPNPTFNMSVGERVYSMDVAKNWLVVATSEKKVSVMNMENINQGFKQIDTQLKYQYRTVNCLPSGAAFAAGATEGRVAFQTMTGLFSKDVFTFKCHRDDSTPANAFPVNDISYHPIHGTMATCGGDGSFHFWDREARMKLKSFSKAGNGVPITCCQFSTRGNLFAYSISYDWCRGHEHHFQGSPVTIKFRVLTEDEVKPRMKK